MAAAVITVTKPSDVQDTVQGNKKIKYRDITADTGDYAPGGFTLTAAQLGLSRHIDFVQVGSLATQGTAGAAAVGIGVRYGTGGTSAIFQIYEVDTAADGAPFQEKGAEAYAANFTFRIKVEGI